MQNEPAKNDLFTEVMANVFTSEYINFRSFPDDPVLLNFFVKKDDGTCKIDENKLRHNINYLYHVVSNAVSERIFRERFIIDEFYKDYIKPYLNIDIRTQRKHLSDTITLDNFMGAIGAAFLKYINSDKFSFDMSWLVDRYVLIAVDQMKYADNMDISKKDVAYYFHNVIVPNLSTYCNRTSNITKDVTKFAILLINELAKMAFVNHFEFIFSQMIKQPKRYKALKPYIDNIDVLMNGNVPSLFGSCNTLEGYVKDLTELQNKTSDDVTARCTGIVEGIANILKPLLNFVDSTGYPWRLRYESVLALKSEKYDDIINARLENELNICVKAMIAEKEAYQKKLSNCYGFNLVDHVYQLFDEKLTSTRYFDIELYLQNKKRQFLKRHELLMYGGE